MINLTLFLKALGNVLSPLRGMFVDRWFTEPTKFPAIKKVTIEVWCIDGDNRTLLSKVSATERIITEEEKQEVHNKLIIQTIENVLKHYGL